MSDIEPVRSIQVGRSNSDTYVDDVYWRLVLSGKYSHVATSTWRYTTAIDGAALTKAGFKVHASRWSGVRSLRAIVTAENTAISFNWTNEGYIVVDVCALEMDLAKATLVKLQKAFVPEEPKDEQVRVTFWYNTSGDGPIRKERPLDAPAWDEVASNYPVTVREQVAPLMDEKWRPDASGRLLLWQGLPGTGKTYAIRALAHSWKTWCDTSYITDPERLLADSSYLMEVLLHGSDADEDRLYFEDVEDAIENHRTLNAKPADPKWHLVILEDAGELLTKDAKMQTGQSLSRLLNFADGFLGQGLRVMTLITTNETIGDLHEAVSRPGRCASLVEFERFKAPEAIDWLTAKGQTKPNITSDQTLAQLYAHLRGETMRRSRSRQTGFARTRTVGFATV